MQSNLEYPAHAVQELSSGNISSAIQILESTLSLHPNDVATLHLLGLLHLQTNRPDQAFPHLKKATSLDTKEAIVFHHFACCLASMGFEHEAIAHFSRVLDLQGDDLDAELAIGQIHFRNKNYLDALGFFDRALKEHPQSADALKHHQETLNAIKSEAEKVAYNNYGALFIVTQPHSAGNYVFGELKRRLNLCPRQSIVVDLHSSIIRANLDEIVEKGGIGFDHVHPKDENLIVIHHSGLKKLVVQVRDPRQAVYSTTLWYDHIRDRASYPGWPQHELPVMESRLPPGYYSWPLDKKLDFMIETELVYTVDWLSRWHAASADPRWNFKIKITKHEDMKRNADEFFKSIADFYELPAGALQGEVKDSKPGENGRPGEHAFRKGALDEWRHSMSPAQIKRVNELVPGELLDKYGWTL